MLHYGLSPSQNISSSKSLFLPKLRHYTLFTSRLKPSIHNSAYQAIDVIAVYAIQLGVRKNAIQSKVTILAPSKQVS